MNTTQACQCGSCQSGPLERPRYFPRQLITPTDMTLEQVYFRDRLRRHNRLLHGWGVVCGALVCPAYQADGSTLDPWKVTVQPGYVLGPMGDEIVIASALTVDTRTAGAAGASGDPTAGAPDPWCSQVFVQKAPSPVYVAVQYQEVMTRPVRVQPAGCGGDGQCEYSRWCDGFRIGFLDTCPLTGDPPDLEGVTKADKSSCPPCPPQPWVGLARVDFDADGTVVAIDNCSCRRLVISFADFWYKCVSNQPTVTAVTPAQLAPGAAVAATISGTRLDTVNPSSISFGPGITVTGANATNPETLSASLTVDATAKPGPRTLVVAGADCGTAALPGAVTVASAAAVTQASNTGAAAGGRTRKP